MSGPSYLNFDYKNYAWKQGIDYRKSPEQYRVGKGEQGVLTCEPYKSEIVGYWRFKNEEVARISSDKIYELFLNYLEKEDFIGADMARKFLQMGFTRSRRYANYKGGRKYDKEDNYAQLQKGTGDPEKILAADIFFAKWKEAESNPIYAALKTDWKQKYG